MSKRTSAKDDEWWVEAKGYRQEQDLARKRREAKDKLRLVLEYFGLDKNTPREPDFFSWQRVKCPFHDDRKPSASMTHRYFRCHSCDVHGDAIDIVMQQMHLPYEQAVDWVVSLY